MGGASEGVKGGQLGDGGGATRTHGAQGRSLSLSLRGSGFFCDCFSVSSGCFGVFFLSG